MSSLDAAYAKWDNFTASEDDEPPPAPRVNFVNASKVDVVDSAPSDPLYAVDPDAPPPSSFYCDPLMPRVEDTSEERSWPPCPDLAAGRAAPISEYPPSFVRFNKRLSERNWACFAAALGGSSRYYDAPVRDGAYRYRRFENAGVPAAGVLDGCHPQLQSAADGSNRCDGGKLAAACGPAIAAVALATLKATVKPSVLGAALSKCASLRSLALTECAVDAAMLAALPPTIESLRFSECAGLDDGALAAALGAARASLVYVDVEKGGGASPGAAVPGRRAAAVLRDCSLAFLRFSDRNSGKARASIVEMESLAGALEGESALAEALETLHLDPFCDGRCKPTAPRLLDALGACPKLRDVDGVRCPESGSHPTLALLNRFVVNPTDLAKRHAAAPKLRELVVVGDKPYDFTHWSVSAPQLATFKLWGATLVSLVLQEQVARGAVAQIVQHTPRLVHLSLAMALRDTQAFYERTRDYDDAPGDYDDDLEAIAGCCPKLRVLDLSSNYDDSYAAFSEPAVCRLCDDLRHLTDIYMHANGRKWNFGRIDTKRGALRVHHDGSYRCPFHG